MSLTKLFLIDTNTISYIVKGNSPAARARLAGLHGNEIGCMSAITEAELRYGIAKSPNAHRLRASIEGFLAKMRILAFDSDAALAYGQLRARREASGAPLGNLDTLIAAHAISIGATLVTNDKSFSSLEGISAIVNWAADL